MSLIRPRATGQYIRDMIVYVSNAEESRPASARYNIALGLLQTSTMPSVYLDTQFV